LLHFQPTWHIQIPTSDHHPTSCSTTAYVLVHTINILDYIISARPSRHLLPFFLPSFSLTPLCLFTGLITISCSNYLVSRDCVSSTLASSPGSPHYHLSSFPCVIVSSSPPCHTMSRISIRSYSAPFRLACSLTLVPTTTLTQKTFRTVSILPSYLNSILPVCGDSKLHL